MQLIFFLLCLTGVAFITPQVVRRDYFLITTPATWEDAKIYCGTNFEDLACVETADNWYRFTAEAERKGLPVTGWIGLYNTISWVMIASILPTNETIFNWALGQPDNFGGNEQCAAMNSNGTWQDFTCTELKPFICYNDTLKGFIAVPDPIKSWHQSREYCWNNHFDLAFPINSTEGSVLKQMVITQGTSWVGMYRRGWTWTNKYQALNVSWRPGYPNNAENFNDCGSVNNSLIEDKLCDNKFSFFCQKPYTVKMQVMKLKILGDNHVFDPATQSDILQQVKQKLKDHSIMREVNVTWRLHVDGNIFHKEIGG